MSQLGAFDASDLNAFVASQLNARGLDSESVAGDWRDRFEIVSCQVNLDYWLNKDTNAYPSVNSWELLGSSNCTFSTFPRNGLRTFLRSYLRSIGFTTGRVEPIWNVGTFSDDDYGDSRDFELSGEVAGVQSSMINGYGVTSNPAGDSRGHTQTVSIEADGGVVTLTAQQDLPEDVWPDGLPFSGLFPTNPSLDPQDPQGFVGSITDGVNVAWWGMGTGTFLPNNTVWAQYEAEHALFDAGNPYVWRGIVLRFQLVLVIQETSTGVI